MLVAGADETALAQLLLEDLGADVEKPVVGNAVISLDVRRRRHDGKPATIVIPLHAGRARKAPRGDIEEIRVLDRERVVVHLPARMRLRFLGRRLVLCLADKVKVDLTRFRRDRCRAAGQQMQRHGGARTESAPPRRDHNHHRAARAESAIDSPQHSSLFPCPSLSKEQ